jgi:hypothetical protein
MRVKMSFMKLARFAVLCNFEKIEFKIQIFKIDFTTGVIFTNLHPPFLNEYSNGRKWE